MKSIGLRERALNGVMWSSMSQIITQILQFTSIVILARILLPKDFGTVGMALIFTGLISMVNELGLAAAIIQKKEINDSHLSTTFWASVFIGIFTFIVSILAAPFIAAFFRKRALKQIIMVISSGFIISSLGVVHKTLLNKELDFKKLSIIEVISAFFFGLVAISLSAFGFGVWGLILGYLTSGAIEVIFLWLFQRWRPKLVFDFTAFKSLFSFGVNVWLFNFINYGRENIDFFMVGRYLGATPLGFYTLAFNLANMPRRKISTIITRVTFPAFSKVQDANDKLSAAYLQTTSYISMITFPLLAGLIVVAPEFILIVYGPKWLPMVFALQILCVAGMLYSIGTTVGSIFLAKGKPDLQLKWGIFAAVFLSTFVLIGIRFGTNGVAVAVTSYAVLSLLIGQCVAGSLIGLKIGTFLASLLPATIASIVMVAVLSGFRFMNNQSIHLSPLLFLASSISLGGLTYPAILKAFNFKEYASMLGLLKEQIGSARISALYKQPVCADASVEEETISA